MWLTGKAPVVAGESVPAKSVMEVRATDDCTFVNGDAESELLVLQGRPINEPVAQYGPFVMNSDAEIRQAIADFNSGQFGQMVEA